MRRSPFAVDMMVFMVLAVASSDLAAWIVELPRNFTWNISSSENPWSFSSSKFSDKSANFVANAQSSPKSICCYQTEMNKYLIKINRYE